MADNYTPTTDSVRNVYRYADPMQMIGTHNSPAITRERGDNFDLWLAEVKAEAWDEGFDAGEPIRDEYSPGNPYRAQS